MGIGPRLRLLQFITMRKHVSCEIQWFEQWSYTLASQEATSGCAELGVPECAKWSQMLAIAWRRCWSNTYTAQKEWTVCFVMKINFVQSGITTPVCLWHCSLQHSSTNLRCRLAFQTASAGSPDWANKTPTGQQYSDHPVWWSYHLLITPSNTLTLYWVQSVLNYRVLSLMAKNNAPHKAWNALASLIMPDPLVQNPS